ncbi:hypothetical protein LB521_28010 [Mesorhizobium sp. BR-1-1-8]|uniref:hypothetical protein n=1 Tax=Mesorhizobium sp. BR-1-1-8 TaxID=2876659 RepID=UPI001CCFD9AE|nr:hypothetical protein [Mesorhizobium sp. BR-1-1-8]MBZ9984984.1 hypothetical protein [Mesorhizobium sp. BR-1-1-8]
MKIAGYEFSEGARFQSGAQADAKAVGKHLEKLRKQACGELTPVDVVNDARAANSPLHTFFEWDDGEAAEQYRLSQARGLIRAVVAVYVSEDKPAVRTKAFVHINEAGAPHYRDAAHAMSLASTRTAVLQSAWRELQAWRKKYADLKEFSDLFATIDTLPIKRAA